MPAVLGRLSIESRWIVPMTNARPVARKPCIGGARRFGFSDLLPSTGRGRRYNGRRTRAARGLTAARDICDAGMSHAHTCRDVRLFRAGSSRLPHRSKQAFLDPLRARRCPWAAIAECFHPASPAFGDRTIIRTLRPAAAASRWRRRIEACRGPRRSPWQNPPPIFYGRVCGVVMTDAAIR